jgi:hypothetical protein
MSTTGQQIAEMRICPTCGELKPRYKRRGSCRECENKKDRKVHSLRKTDLAYLERKRRQGREQNWKKAGIENEDGTPFTEIDYNKAFEKQKGCCAICGKHQSEFKQRLAADHNHKTNKFRALLCFPCNKFVIGKLTLEKALKAVEYLRSH